MDTNPEIPKATGPEDVGAHSLHGCCENRGIMAHSSLTQTTVLKGSSPQPSDVKEESPNNTPILKNLVC